MPATKTKKSPAKAMAKAAAKPPPKKRSPARPPVQTEEPNQVGSVGRLRLNSSKPRSRGQFRLLKYGTAREVVGDLVVCEDGSVIFEGRTENA